jgi:hydrogenase-4 component B
MLTGMGLLAAGCIALGLGAPFVVSYIAKVVTETVSLPILAASGGTWVYPVDPGQALLSPPLVAILLLGFLVVPFVLISLYGGRRAGRRLVQDPWACGYGYSDKMSVSASSFDQPVGSTFSAMYLLRSAIQKPLNAIGLWAKRPRDAITRAEPVLENLVKIPATRAVEYLGQHIQALQMGDIRVYCFYIVVTLGILLLVIFR